MSSVTFSITGLADIKKRMATVSDEIAHKATRNALKKAAELVKKAAYDNALLVDDPSTARRIADNISYQYASRVFRRTNGDVVMYRIGVATERGRIPRPNADTGPHGNTPHWHLVEFGTQHARSHPFMRPALANNINPALNAIVVELQSSLNKLSL